MKKLKELMQMKKEDLIDIIYNDQINTFADQENIYSIKGTGKSIPYIGWFWRNIDVIDKIIRIGNCGEFIGIMQNNKWGYPERRMTEEEVNKFIDFIEQLIENWQRGGCVADIHKREAHILCDLNIWMQTLKV